MIGRADRSEVNLLGGDVTPAPAPLDLGRRWRSALSDHGTIHGLLECGQHENAQVPPINQFRAHEEDAVEETTGGGEESSAKDKQVAFSFTSNLLTNAESADGFAALFRALYMALDERQISYLQGTLQLVLQSDTAEQIQQRLAELGITATIKAI